MKKNCISSTHPSLSREWDYDKNGKLTPFDITRGSHTIVYWKCKNGHEFKASPYNITRTIDNRCPQCNSLAFVKPYLLKEWDYDKNKDISPFFISVFSRKKVHWKCKEGHGWEDRICKRSSGWGSCKKCNSLAFKIPKMASEWHPTKNGNISPWDVDFGSQKRVWWKCKCGHEWHGTIGSRTSHNRQCPYCTHQKVYREISLAFLKPELAKQWHSTKNLKLTPWDVTSSSTKIVWWECPVCKSEWKNSVNGRFNHKTCPFCNGKRTNNTNSMEVLRPDLLDEWDYDKNKLPPCKYTIGSSSIVYWKCKKCGSESQSLICEKAKGHQKCLRCRSLGVKHPNLLKQLHPTKNKNFNPYSILPGIRKKIWWQCDKGHEYRMAIGNKACQKQGCPYCSNKKIDRNNCLASLRPDLLKEWNYKNNKISPYEVSVSSGKRISWQCDRGHEWVASIATRNNGHGCPKCRGVMLKDGTHCRSYVEALFYLRLKDEKVYFLHDRVYGASLGRFRYDFYIPSRNEYIEVTSFNKRFHYKHGQYFGYLRKIVKKRRYVINVMNAVFKFIQYAPNKKDMEYIRSNIMIQGKTHKNKEIYT